MNTIKCKNCGADVPDNMKFCSFCGTPVERNNTAAAAVMGQSQKAV